MDKTAVKVRLFIDRFSCFSKSHLQRLAHFMAEYESDNRSAYLRALTQLEKVAVSREFLDGSIQQLLTLPTIKTQICAEKQVILAQYESEQEQLRQTIASLMDKKVQLDAEINRQEKTLKSETNRIKKRYASRKLSWIHESGKPLSKRLRRV